MAKLLGPDFLSLQVRDLAASRAFYADVTEYLNDLLFMPDALLMGQKTYEFFAQVWPSRQGKDAERMNSMPKYVASRILLEPLHRNATLIQGDVAEEIRKLKQESGSSLLQYGVGELTHTMLKHGLVDEFRISDKHLLSHREQVFDLAEPSNSFTPASRLFRLS